MNTNMNMDATTKAELADAVKRYFAANEVKKDAAAEVKEIGEEIKDTMGEAEITEFETEGIVASISARSTKSLDTDALMTWLSTKGLRIPENCWVTKTAAVLNVKAAKKTKKAA